MTAGAGWYPDPDDVAKVRWWDGNAWTTHTQPSQSAPGPGPLAGSTSAIGAVPPEVSQISANIEALRREEADLRSQVVESRNIALLQEVGIYQYSHPLDDSAQYKGALEDLEGQLQAAIKNGLAVATTKKWAINGSEKDGAKMVSDFGKLLLRAYNTEADNLVRTLRPHSIDSAIARLSKTRASISKLAVSMKIEIKEDYHALRVKELQLTADYLARVAEEKEKEREQKARLKEEEAAQREYQREQERLEKERAHYEQALTVLRFTGTEGQVADTEKKLAEIDRAIEGVVTRAANVRAGFVYVISNTGAFGERVVKIGLTRRLEPLERIRELGGASVPFGFDVHAMIFSDDAVGLETALHQMFAHRQVNLVNSRKEFFYATPVEVKQALLKLRGTLLTYRETADAEEWRQTETTRRQFAGESKAAPPIPSSEA